MALRFQMKINWGDVAGWTEEFYVDSTLPPASPAIQAAMRLMALQRAGCLTRNARIVALIASDPLNPRIAAQTSVNFPGALGESSLPAGGADAPFVALKVNLITDGSSRRSYLMRGLPDGDVVGGIVTFAASTRPPYQNWFDFITGTTNGLGLWNGSNGAPASIKTLNGQGILTLFDDGPMPVAGNNLYISTQVVGNGAKIRQIAKVVSVTPDGKIRLRPWTNGDCTDGFVYTVDYSWRDISILTLDSPNRARFRKTGRPFGLYRGKASAAHGK